MPELSLNLLSILFGLAFFISILLYLREYNLRRKLESEGDKFLQSIKEKGWQTLHQSIKKSQDLLGEAELEGVKVVASSKLETSKLEQEYSKKLSELVGQSQQTITSAQEQLIQFMASLQKRSQEFEEVSRQTGEQRINQLFERLENKLADFLVQTEQKTTSSIELELRAARQLIDTYKTQQLKLIDENILAMMEQTLNIVLSKKLSLKDQLDLVYEALEKAKVEKFIV